MSTSFLYHAFGTRGYQYVRTTYTGGEVIFTIRQDPQTCRCSACGSNDVVSRGQVERRFRSLPIGLRATSLVLPIPRVECRACGLVRQADVTFADPRRTYTKAFERYVLELSRRMTIRDVAAHLNVGWDLVKDIQKRDLSRRYAKPKLKHLRRIAIDEIAVAKGHRYMTIVMDLDSGAVVFVGDGKGADALKPFWKRLRPSGAKIEAVAMDMSAAYRGAVSTYLPKATIVFDHFHVIKLFNDKLSNLRRSLYHQAEDEQKKVLKGSRWRHQRCCKTVADPRLCHTGDAPPAEARRSTAAPVRRGLVSGGRPRAREGGVIMSTSPRRPPPAPLIRRRYEPSRLQFDSLISAYLLVIPGVARRLGSPARRPGEPGRADSLGGHSRPSVVGA